MSFSVAAVEFAVAVVVADYARKIGALPQKLFDCRKGFEVCVEHWPTTEWGYTLQNTLILIRKTTADNRKTNSGLKLSNRIEMRLHLSCDQIKSQLHR